LNKGILVGLREKEISKNRIEEGLAQEERGMAIWYSCDAIK